MDNEINPLNTIILTRPGDPRHEVGAHGSCHTCGQSTGEGANDIQIAVSANINQDPAVFCLSCWRAANEMIEYHAIHPSIPLA